MNIQPKNFLFTQQRTPVDTVSGCSTQEAYGRRPVRSYRKSNAGKKPAPVKGSSVGTHTGSRMWLDNAGLSGSTRNMDIH